VVDDVKNGAKGHAKLTGIFSLPKVGSQAWSEGDAVHWDAGNKRCTTVASGNRLIGSAVEAVGSGATLTTGIVRLNGIAGVGNAVAAASS
jgi:predicted RecA/RadA family phage recombinase